ncbi:MAG: hypothetical protein IT290_02515 [Deltaproteobacteria bacterium]|nr:hypothetical protein [Deltaproteobacteria bacterium]
MALQLSSSTVAIKYREKYLGQSVAEKPARSSQLSSTPEVNFQNKAQLSAPPASDFEEATEVQLSRSAQARKDQSEQSGRKLSNTAAFVNVAQNAVNKISDLLAQAKQNTDELETEVNPNRRQSLSEETEALFNEIETINEDASLNGESVVNAGAKTFEFDFSREEPVGDRSFSFQVGNIALSSSDLGVDGLDAASIESDSAAATAVIEEAERRVQLVNAELENARGTLSAVVDSTASAAASDVRAEQALSAEGNAQAFAEKVAESLESSIVEARESHDLQADQVKNLLADDDEPAAADASAEGEVATQQLSAEEEKRLSDFFTAAAE